MTIHHATQKKAEKLDIEISEVETTQDTLAQASGFLHPKAKTVLQAAEVARQLGYEYPALSLQQPDDEDHRFALVFTDPTTQDETTVIDAQDDVPSLAECLEATEAEGFDPEAQTEEPEEEKETGTVVNPRYRAIYKERGDPNHCGDWLALQLKGRFTTIVNGKETFDPEAFFSFLRINEVDLTGRWAQLPTAATPGWQGRLRMNGRQRLEKVVAHRGTLFVEEGTSIELPTDELERLRAKHPEPKKRRKAQTQEAQEAETA